MRELMVLALLPWVALNAWAQPSTTGAFTAGPSVAFIPERGPVAAVEFTYPGHTTSQPGEYARWLLPTVSPGAQASLTFYWTDSFSGAVAGYHVLQVLLGERVLWEQDVAGDDLELRAVDVPLAAGDLPPAGAPLDLSLRLIEKKQVTNFPIRVQVADPTLRVGDQRTPLLPNAAPPPATAWPPDPRLPSLPVVGGWTWQASIIQPWGATQTVALKQAAAWAPRLAREHGLNAMIVLPPEAHNAITGAVGKPDSPQHLTDAEFRQAIALYRREGIRLILYSSIMHLGHDPQWQLGELGRTHPEWAMRDPQGATVNLYGNPWLCPATGALQATLDYTARLVRAYDADAVMLDNNEFMATTGGGWTCYCDGCKAQWRAYLTARFGAGRIPGTDIRPGAAPLPEQSGDPLWGLWLGFRNRQWAEACEAYRRELRRIKPGLVLLANTQYLHPSGLLAVDGQYAHLDAVLSESRGHTPLRMAGKMLLGRALAEGRPLWNYIGTFEEKDFTRLRPPDEIAGLCAASEAVGANPWIVFYGFEGEANQASLAVLRRYTDFWHANADLLGASTLQGEVGVLVSTESRDQLAAALLPGTVEALLRRGVAVRPWRDGADWTAARLRALHVMLATSTPCLRASTAGALAAWVRAGGTLIVTPDVGWRDENGRWRTQSALAEALRSSVARLGSHACGAGRVVCVADEAAALQALQPLAEPRCQAAGPVAVFRQQARDGRHIISLVGLEHNLGDVQVRLPGGARQVELRVPGQAPQPLTPAATLACRIQERLALIVYRASGE